MRFRPPAVPILNCLPAGAVLSLIPEPSNPYDDHAVQVWVNADQIPEGQHEELNMQAQGFGSTLAEILAQGDWMLGFVSKNENQTLFRNLQSEVCNYRATLGFNAEGKPKVE